MERRWITMDGLVNLRDVGGIPTADGGKIASGRLFRSDHLQRLTPEDIDDLIGLGVTDVVDLRSDWESRQEGPGPLTDHATITVRRHSLFHEQAPGIGEDKPNERPEVLPEEALPWVDLQPSVELDDPIASIYMAYVVDRPDSIIAALTEIADADGATLVHCAAGKDRTGTVVALALSAAGADRRAIIEDYAASTERTAEIVDKLMKSPVYEENLRGRPLSSHDTHAEVMESLLDHIDAAYGGVVPLLREIGMTENAIERLRTKLRD